MAIEKGKLELALEAAQNLDLEEQQGFVLYKPKFRMDSDFALEREEFNRKEIEAIMNNSKAFEFGLFESECAGALPK